MNRPGPALDRHFPRCGPCLMCGGADKRHRLWDAIADRRRGGETAKSIARDYRLPVAAVLAVLRVRP